MIAAIVITAIVSILVTVLLMLFIYSKLLKNIDNEYTSAIKMCWDQIEKTAINEKLSVGKYIEKHNDQDYAIIFLGKIFMLLNKNMGEKEGEDLQYQPILSQCNDYLQVALKDDIKEFKNKQVSQKDMLKEDIKNLQKRGEN